MKYNKFFLILCFFLIPGIFKAIHGQNSFIRDDSIDFVVIDKITFEGNKITKERIIFRELLFREGDTIAIGRIEQLTEQSRKNLMNTSLFNFVTIHLNQADTFSPRIDVLIEFIERWYIWPVPIIELADRNFNEWLEKMNFKRVNYGMYLTWNNFRGRRERLVLYSRFGYDERYNLGYQIPYINRKQTLGLGFAGGFSRNHEIAYNSIENKEVYYRSETDYPRTVYFGYSEISYRKGIHNMHRGLLGFTDLRLTDTVLELNPDFAFGGSTRNQFMTVFYQFRSDFRDLRQYPLKGHYFDIEVDKKGIGLFSEPIVNSLYLKSNLRAYSNLKNRFYWASGLTGKTSLFWDQPYYYLQGLGYGRDFVRGYEFYVIDGQHYGLLKNNLKFELIPNSVAALNFIPTEKFNKLYYAVYLNLFTDLGYVFDSRNISTNPLANEILVGYGIGLDLVTYYDFVLRVEYSINRRGESGFFFHFMPSI
ncbi:MAG: POTRA domain-containing protein [Bacteroidales bacterium]